MTLPSHRTYVESGVAWLGRIPSHWRVFRLKDIAKVINGYPFDSKLFEVDGTHPLVRIRDLDAQETATRYSGEFVADAAVTSADVLIGMDGEFNVGRWLGAEPALLNQRMCCVRASNRALSQFLLHALPIPLRAINDVTYSTTVKHLSSADVEKLRVGLPDPDELAAIAAFLDYETAKIDGLIAEQEKLIALLAEKRQATISHAVTRGLNPQAPMKDSGVPWLGEVPAHWAVKQLRYVASVVRGASPRPAGDPRFFAADSESGANTPWVTVAEVTKDESMLLTEVNEFLTPDGVANSQSFRAGTLLFTNSGATLGVPKILGIDCCANDGIVAFNRLDRRIQPVDATH